jgi:hypothetical protein
VVLLLNAAYRDGATEQPYPRAIGVALRVLVPLTLVIALTSTWSLFIRSREYGLTVDRVWGWVVALTAIALTAGYSVCAFRKERWMRGMDRVNTDVMVALVIVLALTLTPALSPYRLAANSQNRVLRAGQPTERPEYANWRNGVIDELRFNTGEYGKQKLRTLTADSTVPKDVSQEAAAALAKDAREYGPRMASADSVKAALPQLPLYPKGRTLPADLASAIDDAVRVRRVLVVPENTIGQSFVGVFIDLTGDGVEDFALIAGERGLLFEQANDAWRITGHLAPQWGCGPTEDLLSALEGGRFGARPPHAVELEIGAKRFVASPAIPCWK